jgi:type II secretory pathway component PulJ
MLVAVALTGIISVGVNAVILQMSRQNNQGTAHMTATKQLESAVHWFHQDVQTAQTVQTGGGSGFPLTLGWTDWDNNSHQIVYTLQDDEIERSYTVNGGQAVETVIARFLVTSGGATSCNYTDNVFCYTLTSSVSSNSVTANKTRSGQIIPRPGL